MRCKLGIKLSGCVRPNYCQYSFIRGSGDFIAQKRSATVCGSVGQTRTGISCT